MSTCKFCGDHDISWAKSGESTRMVPLNRLGTSLVIDRNGAARHAATYKIHRCEPEAIEAYTEKLEQDQRDREDYLNAREEANRVALEFPCPRCGVPNGSLCLNLTDVKKSQDEPDVVIRNTAWPHQERLPSREGVDV